MKRKKKVLITGGAGFIGSNLVANLQYKFNIIVIDRLDFGLSNEMKKLIKERKITFIKSDLNNLKYIKNRLGNKKIDNLIHLASITHIPECEKDHIYCFNSNFISLVSLLNLLNKNVKIINFSTSATYSKKNTKHKETQIELEPIDIYGLGKLFSEKYLNYLCDYNNYSVINIKLANAVGQGETNEKLFGTIFKQIEKNKNKIIKLGNMSPKRDYIHVKDISFVVEKLITRNLFKKNKLFNLNLGTGYKPISVKEVFDYINNIKNNTLILKKENSRIREISKERELLALDVTRLKKLIPDFQPKKIGDWIDEVTKNPKLRF